MTTIESKTVINKPLAEVYKFLADLNNHQQLMPDNIYNWTSNTDEAWFTIQNMAKLALKISGRLQNEAINISPLEKPPFDVELKWALKANGDKTEVTYTILADLNMMMKMMASGPLKKLADHETETLGKVLA
jgi:carbon monoxide dehydrogenase subunit G